MPERIPHVLAVLPGLFPSTIIGVAKPLLRLDGDERVDLDLTVQYLTSTRAVSRADVLVMCHTIDPQYGWILDAARERRLPLIYEIDDDLLDVPADIPGLDYLRQPARRALLERCLRQADVVRVYSPVLQQKLSAYNDRVELVAGPLDWSLMPFDSTDFASQSPSRSGSTTVKIVYATSRLADRIGEMLVRPMRDILDRFPQVELTVWGPRHAGFADHPRVVSRPIVRDYDSFFEQFARAGFDIGLAPLPDDAFHRGKSNNKFREYAACGIAGVYSDMPVYNTSVADGETGLLAANTEQAWIAAIERLVTEPALRSHIARAAREYARAHFTEQVTDETWLRQIHSVPRRPTERATSAATRAPAGGSAVAFLGHVSRLGAKAVPVMREHGVGTALKRTWTHLTSFAQLMQWQRQRRRLEQRVAASRGRS